MGLGKACDCGAPSSVCETCDYQDDDGCFTEILADTKKATGEQITGVTEGIVIRKQVNAAPFCELLTGFDSLSAMEKIFAGEKVRNLAENFQSKEDFLAFFGELSLCESSYAVLDAAGIFQENLSQEKIDLLVQILQECENPKVCTLVLHMVHKAAPAMKAKKLDLVALNHAVLTLRHDNIYTLSIIGDLALPESTDFLIALLNEPHKDFVYETVLDNLGKIRSPQSLSALLVFAKKRSYLKPICIKAISVMGIVANEQAVNPAVANEIGAYLAGILRQGESDPAFVQAAVSTLGYLRLPCFSPEIAEHLKHPVGHVRLAVFLAMKNAGCLSTENLAALQDLARDPSYRERNAAAEVIQAIEARA